MERNIATMELTRYAAVAINTDVARAMRRRGTVELQVLVAPGRILTLHDVTVTGNTSGAEGGGGGGFVAKALATAGIIMSTKTNKIATRAKPSNRYNFRIPFVMADPSSSTTFYSRCWLAYPEWVANSRTHHQEERLSLAG